MRSGWAAIAAGLLACGAGEGAADGDVVDAVVSVDATVSNDALVPDDAIVSNDAPVPATLGYSPCPADARVGRFSVVLAEDFTSVEGRVMSAVVPAYVREERDAEAGCRLLEGRRLFCDPPCGPAETCGLDQRCVAFPVAQSVGTVQLSGLSVPLVMEPSAFGAYSSAAVTIPHPGFAPGEVIRLGAPGEVLPALELEGRGVAALEMATPEVALEPGEPLTVRWTPGAEPSARVELVLELARHGGVAASLECDGVMDDGLFALPARLVEALLERGVAGFPTLIATRRSADSQDISNGCVELLVLSSRVLAVRVPGVRSCSDDGDCAPGERCRADLTCGSNG